MANVTKQDYLTRLNAMFGEEPTDEQLSLIEDFSDIYDSGNIDKVNQLQGQVQSLEQKVAETEKTWKQKYRDRFMNEDVPDPQFDDDEPEKKLLKFDDLFTTK